MATTNEIDEFIKLVMQKNELTYGGAAAFALGFFTQYIPSEEVADAIRYMEKK